MIPRMVWSIVIGGGAGVFLGMLFGFGLLWTLHRVQESRWPVLFFLSSFTGRMVPVFLGFWLIRAEGGVGLFFCLAGFLGGYFFSGKKVLKAVRSGEAGGAGQSFQKIS